MRKNIWFIVGGAILIITLVITIIQGYVLTTLLITIIQGDVLIPTSQPPAVVPPSAIPILTETSIAPVQPPLIGEPRVHAFAPLKPGEETVISVDVSSAIGISLTYTWHADGGRIVRGQGSPAITYRAPDGSGSYGVRVVVKWDGQSVEKAASIKVEEKPTPTPTPTSQSPTDTPTATLTPRATPTATPTPRVTPTARPTLPPLSPDAAKQQLAPFDQKMQEFDDWVKQTEPKKLEKARCPYLRLASGECWMYPIGIGNVILVEEYTYVGPLLRSDVYIYDFDGDGQSEILKWDLERDGEFDVIEYDVDEDGMLDFALGDANANGQFDDDEIYMYQSTARRWRPLVYGALPFPVLPIFPY